MQTRHMLSAKAKRQLAVLSGYKCSFPGCEQNLMLDGASFIGQLASIEAIHSHGSRHNPAKNEAELLEIDNYLLLCPNHHLIIDRQPEIYSVEWLKKAREDHLKKVAGILSLSQAPAEVKLDDEVEISLEQAIGAWQTIDKMHLKNFGRTYFRNVQLYCRRFFLKVCFS
ncbi:hypothetical protein [Vreelandella sulfidaeris]|uniref:hypothetical protein n=1 Tax=Vreelandella sulfidaeris TaxID=115553 RepID=UPI0018AD4D6B|nr:hypothetical protein [Halomonas sulfidaeris]